MSDKDIACRRCGLTGFPSPGVGHMCFHPHTGEQYADQFNREHAGAGSIIAAPRVRRTWYGRKKKWWEK